jgi:hypothetical protein
LPQADPLSGKHARPHILPASRLIMRAQERERISWKAFPLHFLTVLLIATLLLWKAELNQNSRNTFRKISDLAVGANSTARVGHSTDVEHQA